MMETVEQKDHVVELYDRTDIPKRWRVARFIKDGNSTAAAASKFGLSLSMAKVYWHMGKSEDLINPPPMKVPANRYRTPRNEYRKGQIAGKGYDYLSNREKEVVDLCRQGLFNKEIADRLFVCEKTVKFHLTNSFRILNVKSRAQLIAMMPWTEAVTEKKVEVETVKRLADFPKPIEKSWEVPSDKVDFSPDDSEELKTYSEASLPIGFVANKEPIVFDSPTQKIENKSNDYLRRAIEGVLSGKLSPEAGHAVAALLRCQ